MKSQVNDKESYNKLVQKCSRIKSGVVDEAIDRSVEELDMSKRSFAKLVRALVHAWKDGKIDAELLRPYVGV